MVFCAASAAALRVGNPGVFGGGKSQWILRRCAWMHRGPEEQQLFRGFRRVVMVGSSMKKNAEVAITAGSLVLGCCYGTGGREPTRLSMRKFQTAVSLRK